MNTTAPSTKSYLLLILLITVLIGITGCATPVSQKPDNIDKKELAIRLKNSISFIDAINEQAKNSNNQKIHEILNKAQHLSLDAKDDFMHERYKNALNKVNEAYRLGLNALAILKADLPPTSEEQQYQLQLEAKRRLQINETYLNAVKRTFGYITTEAAEADFKVAKKDREKALYAYKAKSFKEAIQTANKSTDILILILTDLENIEHNKDQ